MIAPPRTRGFPPPRDVTIIGAGGHGQDLKAIVDAWGSVCRLVDDDPEHDYAVPVAPRDWIVGINDPLVRKVVAGRFDSQAANLIHPTAVIGPDVAFDSRGGIAVGPGAILHTKVWLGEHVHVGYGASMTRTQVNAFTTIAPGVTICGDVNIGDGAFIGAGCVIKNLVSIGAGAVVGCGAVVVSDVPAGATVKGNPAR